MRVRRNGSVSSSIGLWLASICFIGIILCSHARHADAYSQTPLQTTLGIIEPSLTLLRITSALGSTTYCTGSVVDSDRTGSTIMTAAHCLQGDISNIDGYYGVPPVAMNNGTLLSRGNPFAQLPTDGNPDIAFIRFSVRNIPKLAVAIGPQNNYTGDEALIVGYPRYALNDWLNGVSPLMPEDQNTTINMRNSGWNINEIVTTDEGNSGGPIVDLNTHEIVGIVHGEINRIQGGALAPASIPPISYGFGYMAIRRFAASSNVPLPISQANPLVPARLNQQSIQNYPQVDKLVPGIFEHGIGCTAPTKPGDKSQIYARIFNDYSDTIHIVFGVSEKSNPSMKSFAPELTIPPGRDQTVVISHSYDFTCDKWLYLHTNTWIKSVWFGETIVPIELP
jgi:Trypsin-like peptidase domain